MKVAIVLFFGGIAMGIAGAFVWAWAVHAGQFHDMESTKRQLFWPDLAPENDEPGEGNVEERAPSGRGR